MAFSAQLDTIDEAAKEQEVVIYAFTQLVANRTARRSSNHPLTLLPIFMLFGTNDYHDRSAIVVLLSTQRWPG